MGHGRRYAAMRGRQRAGLGLLLVALLAAVLGVIVFTELLLMETGHQASTGSLLGRATGSMSLRHRHKGRDYDDLLQVQSEGGGTGASAGLQGKGRLSDNPGDPAMISEHQLPPYPTHLNASDGRWQPVNGTRYKFHVFSAYYDNRKNKRPVVRIIGVTKTRGSDKVWCRLWYRQDGSNFTNYSSRIVPAKLEVIRENWGLPYSACFVLCPLGSGNVTVPSAVSLVYRIRLPPGNLLSVTNNLNLTRPESRFGVCVKPFHFQYNRAIHLLEFLEMHLILGVSHFTFYNHTIGGSVECILREYINEGLVTLLPWDLLNMSSQKEVRTENMFAALNDCLYRSMNRYSHVLMVDLDEYIIGRMNGTLPELVQHLDHRFSRSPGAYSFQNAFFYLQWVDDASSPFGDDPLESNLLTMTKTRRRSKLHPHKQRSKYICRPELVIEVGNHFVWEFVPGYGTMNVPPDAGILHHYRICEFGGDGCINTSSLIDRTALRYRVPLVRAVRRRLDELGRKCDVPEPQPKSGAGGRALGKIIIGMLGGENR